MNDASPHPNPGAERPRSRDFSVQKAPPPPGKPRNVDYPEIPEQDLPSGLKVLVVEDHRLPRVTVRVGLTAGRAHGPAENLALPGLTMDLLEEGTETRNSRELAAELDHYAIQVQSEVLMEYSLFAMTVLEDHLEKGLELLSDLLLRPVFPEHELEKVRARWKSSLIAERTEPDFLARERTYKTVFNGHPYQRVSVPVEHVDSVTREQIEAYYRSNYMSNGTLLLFSGPIDLRRAVELADKYLGHWGTGEGRQVDYPAVERIRGPVLRLVHRPGSVQTRIAVSGRVPPRPDSDLLRFRVANQVLGGGASSRLFLNLREAKGYTYGAYSQIRAYIRDGLFIAAADVNLKHTLSALKETLGEIDRMHEAPPEAFELERSRAEIVGSFIRQMETSSLVGYLELHRRLNELPEDYYRTFIPVIQSIGEEDVVSVSREYFDLDRLALIVVGDRNKLEGKLSRLGSLEVYDTEGRLLES